MYDTASSSSFVPRSENIPRRSTSPLNVDQRVRTIAAVLQARVAGWPLDHTGPQTLRGLLRSLCGPAQRNNARVSEAAVTNMIDGLLSGRVDAFQDAYLDLLQAGRDAKGRTDLRQASDDFRKLKAICLADAAFLVDDLKLDTSAALAELFIDAVDADTTTRFRLDFRNLDRPADLVGLPASDTRVRAWAANTGVRLELLDAIERLHGAGVTGPVEWVSDRAIPGLGWRPEGTTFVAQGDLRPLIWSNYAFDPVSGLRIGTARTFVAPAIADSTPLRALAVLDADVHQTLDRDAGTVQLEWLSAGASNATRLEILPSPGVTLDESLARLDIMVSALISDGGDAVLDRLPAQLTLDGDQLRNVSTVVARRVDGHWQFERGDAWHRPAPPTTFPSPMTGDGRAMVIGRQISDAKFAWPSGLPIDEQVEHACVLDFESAHEVARRSMARTLMSGILTDSMPALLRAHRLLLDEAYQQDADVARAQEAAAADFERMVGSARLRIEAHDDARLNTVVIDGLEQARLLADALKSSPDTPDGTLRLRYDALRRAIEAPASATLVDRRHAALVLSMRDRLNLLSDSGVIGPVGYARRRRPPAREHREAWRATREDAWISDKGFLREQWSAAVFDPTDETVKSIRFNDLIDQWDEFANLLEVKDRRRAADGDAGSSAGGDSGSDSSGSGSDASTGKPPSRFPRDALTLDELESWTEETLLELKYLRMATRGERAAAMTAQAWRRRLDQVRDLERRAGSGTDVELQSLCKQLVTLIAQSALHSATPGFKALFLEDGLTIVDDHAPLSTLRHLRPGLSQVLDRKTGRLTLGDGHDQVVWEVPPLEQPHDGQARRRQDLALRQLDASAVARLDTLRRSLSSDLPKGVKQEAWSAAGQATTWLESETDSDFDDDVEDGFNGAEDGDREALPDSDNARDGDMSPDVEARDVATLDPDSSASSKAVLKTPGPSGTETLGTETPGKTADPGNPAGSSRQSVVDADAVGERPPLSTGETTSTVGSAQTPDPGAMEIMIAAWFDQQALATRAMSHWAGGPVREPAPDKMRTTELLIHLRLEADTQLWRLLGHQATEFSAMGVLALEEHLQALASKQQRASRWTRQETLQLLTRHFDGHPQPLPTRSRQASGARLLFAAFDAARHAKNLEIDADQLKVGYDGDAGSRAAAMSVADMVPMLMELSRRGVFGEVLVHASDAQTRRNGVWRQAGGRHVSASPLHELLGYSVGDELKSWPLDPRNALPGLNQLRRYSRSGTFAASNHQFRAQLRAFVSKSARAYFLLRSKEKDVTTTRTYEVRDRNDAGASAMDMDVAIARLVGDGSWRRCPPDLGWNGQHLVLLRADRKGPLAVMSRLFTRTPAGALIPDWRQIHDYRRFADDLGAPPDVLGRRLTTWRNELTPGKRGSSGWIALKDGKIDDPAAKRQRPSLKLVVLQMDDTPQAFEASLRHMARPDDRGRVLWVQADRHGASRVRAGGELSDTTSPADEVKLVIVGQGSTGADHDRLLSGYTGRALALRIAEVLKLHFKGRPPFGQRVTLLSCDLESRFSRAQFVDEFTAAFQPGKFYDVTSFRGQVLFPVDDPDSARITQRWTLDGDDRQALHRASDRVFVSRRAARNADADRTVLTTRAKYGPAASTASTASTRLSEDATTAARETALDTPGSEVDHLIAAVEKDILFFMPSLADTPSAALKALFADARGRVDTARLQRVASSPAELALLLDDLRAHLTVSAPERVDAISATGWLDGSLAGRMLKIHGQELPAQFLSSLGARIDGAPLTAALMAGKALAADDDWAARLTVDADLLAHVLPLLPDDPESAVRIDRLAAWLRSRQSTTDAMTDAMTDASFDAASSPFHGVASRRAWDMADRLARAAASGNTADIRIAAGRGQTVEPPSLLDDIVRDLSPDTQAAFIDYLGRQPDQRAGTRDEALFDVLTRQSPALDRAIDQVSRTTSRDAEARLVKRGLVEIDANGRPSFRLDRLPRHPLGAHGAADVVVAGDLLSMRQDWGDQLAFQASAEGGDPTQASWVRDLAKVRAQRPQLLAAFTGKRMNQVSNAIDGVTSVLGLYQLLHQGPLMSAQATALAGVQASAIVLAPMSAAVGRFLHRSITAGGFGVMKGLSRAIGAGLVSVPLQMLTAPILADEWASFEASGAPKSGYVYDALVANTVISTTSTLLSLGFTALQIAASLVSVAGNVLAKMAAAAGMAAAPLAVLTFLAQAATNIGLWYHSYGQHFRGEWQDHLYAVLAKMFGQATDATRRAEVAHGAASLADQRQTLLRDQREQDLVFQSDLHAKQGYGTLHAAHREVEVRPVTFRVPHGGKDYLIALQDRERVGTGFFRKARPEIGGDGSGMAWMAFGSDGFMPAKAAASRDDRQLFRLGGVTTAHVVGGGGDDSFLLDLTTRITRLSGGAGVDEVVVQAGGADVSLSVEPTRQGLTIDAATPGGIRPIAVDGIERWVVRDAGKASLYGGDQDETFDVSGREVTLHGGGGRNVFVLQAGVRVVSSSDDTLLWRGDGDAIVAMQTSAATLTLRIDGVLEQLRLSRKGRDLRLAQQDRPGLLTLQDYFPDGGPSSDAGSTPLLRPLVMQDATRTTAMIDAPHLVPETPLPFTDLTRTMQLPKDAPHRRRLLTGAPTPVRYRLASGSGTFSVEAGGRQASSIIVLLDLPLARLRYRRERTSLIIEELIDGKAGTTLTLLDWTTRDERHAPPLMMALGDGTPEIPGRPEVIRLPDESDPDSGALSRASLAAAGEETSAEAMALPLQPGTGAAAATGPVDLGDAVFLHEGAVDVAVATTPGRHLVRRTTPLEPSPRLIHLPDDPARATIRSAGLMLIMSFGEGRSRVEVMVRDYYRLLSRPIGFSWDVGQGGRHETLACQLPTDDRGRLAAAYGALIDPSWWVALDAIGVTDGETIRSLKGLDRRLGGNGEAVDLRADARVDPALVRLYLRLHGLPETVAAGLKLHTVREVSRALHWMAVADAPWPAATLEGLSRQREVAAESVARHRPLLKHLAQSRRGADYVTQVLRLDLDLAALNAFETWVASGGNADRDTTLADMKVFAGLLRREAGCSPDSPLLKIVLKHRGYAGEQIDRMAAMMVSTTIVDDRVVAELMRHGVSDPALLGRLHEAGLRGEALMLGNTLRHAIDGDGDRGASVAVSAGLGFSTPGPESVTRYLITEPLRLDVRGDRLQRLERLDPLREGSPVSDADLMPGEVLDQNGQAPVPDVPLKQEVERLFRERDALDRTTKWPESRGLDGYVARGYEALAKKAGGPAVLEEQGWARRITEGLAPSRQFWKRSRPEFLVDGIALAGEALGWRPHVGSDDQQRLLPLTLTGTGDTALQFDFKQPILLGSLTLHVGMEVVDKARPDRSTGRWKVQARQVDGHWRDASATQVIANGVYALRFDVETAGVPHRTYRLLGVEGSFPLDAWFTEVTFSTAEAGGGVAHRDTASTSISQAGLFKQTLAAGNGEAAVASTTPFSDRRHALQMLGAVGVDQVAVSR